MSETMCVQIRIIIERLDAMRKSCSQLSDDEYDFYYSLSEHVKESSRGEAISVAAGTLNDVVDETSDLIDKLESLIQ